MGISWLTVAEFEQMCGRAGRYGKHNQAKAMILCEPGKSYNAGQLDSEEKIALSLLKGKIETIFLDPDEDKMYTEVLAFLSMKHREGSKTTIHDLKKFQAYMLNNDFNLKSCFLELMQHDFIEPLSRDTSYLMPTPFGMTCSSSFFTLNQCKKIRESLETGKNWFDLVEENMTDQKPENLLVQMAIDINPFKNFYISNALTNEIKTITGKQKSSTLLFSNQVLSLLKAQTFDNKRKLPKFIKNVLLDWTQDLFTCTCEDNPYCECGRKKIQEIMIGLRIEGLKSVDEIRQYFMDNYQIQIFRGDLYDFYDQVIYNLRSIFEISQTIKIHPKILVDVKDIPSILENLMN